MLNQETAHWMFEKIVLSRHFENAIKFAYLRGKTPCFNMINGPIAGEMHLSNVADGSCSDSNYVHARVMHRWHVASDRVLGYVANSAAGANSAPRWPIAPDFGRCCVLVDRNQFWSRSC